MCIRDRKKAPRQACLKGYVKHSIEELFSLCNVKPEKTFRESLTTKEPVSYTHLHYIIGLLRRKLGAQVSIIGYFMTKYNAGRKLDVDIRESLIETLRCV